MRDMCVLEGITICTVVPSQQREVSVVVSALNTKGMFSIFHARAGKSIGNDLSDMVTPSECPQEIQCHACTRTSHPVVGTSRKRNVRYARVCPFPAASASLKGCFAAPLLQTPQAARRQHFL